MKLVLTNFGQDISLTGEATTVYLVFTDEETGRVFRLPTTQDTITRLAQVTEGDYEGEPPMPGDEPQPPEDEVEEPAFAEADQGELQAGLEEPEESAPPVPVIPPPRKRIVRVADAPQQPSTPMRAAMAKVKQRLDQGDAEGKVPSL